MIKDADRPLLLKFGQHLAQLRKAKKLSQRDLSHRCRIDNAKIGAIERGEINLTLVSIAELASGLEVHISELLKFDVNNEGR